MPTAGVSSSSPAGFSENIGEILGDVSIFTAAGESVMIKDLWDQEEGVAVVALLRHFGCICCWELASKLKESKSRFDSAGVKLIAVGVGTPGKARILAERVSRKKRQIMSIIRLTNLAFPLTRSSGTGWYRKPRVFVKMSKETKRHVAFDYLLRFAELPFPMDSLYADPDRKAYDVLGLHYGFGRIFNRASARFFLKFGALKKVWKSYTIKAIPDDKSSILQQGGIFVFKGKQLLYARKDKGISDHAPLDEILNICCPPVA